jgi:tellurite resistance protein
MATFALRWLALEHPAGGIVYGWILLAAATGLIGAIAVRTILAGARGQLLPARGAAAAEPSGRIGLSRSHRRAA